MVLQVAAHPSRMDARGAWTSVVGVRERDARFEEG